MLNICSIFQTGYTEGRGRSGRLLPRRQQLHVYSTLTVHLVDLAVAAGLIYTFIALNKLINPVCPW